MNRVMCIHHDWLDEKPCPYCVERRWEPPTAPSTPAPQGEKCAHAPEIDLSAFDGHTPGPWDVGALIHCECGSSPNCWHNFDYQRDIYPPPGESGPVAIVSGESSKDSLLIAAAPQLLAALARERESRKQAEAALRRVDTALTMALDSRELSKYVYGKIGELLRPVQEPAERERGK